MKVRFQTDADFNRNITTGLRLVERRVEIQTAEEAGLRGKPDPEVLEYCADHERLLLTHDAKTMPGHFGEFLMRRSSPGVIVVPQALGIGRVVRRLHALWLASHAEQWRDTIAWLDA